MIFLATLLMFLSFALVFFPFLFDHFDTISSTRFAPLVISSVLLALVLAAVSGLMFESVVREAKEKISEEEKLEQSGTVDELYILKEELSEKSKELIELKEVYNFISFMRDGPDKETIDKIAQATANEYLEIAREYSKATEERNREKRNGKTQKINYTIY